MASAQSPHFVRIDENIAVDGGIDESNVLFLAENYKSVLYLCVDSESDCGVTGGFATIQKHFPGNSSLHVVMNSQSSCFKPDEQNLVNIMKSYRSFELALNRLPKPVAVVCKTNRRASTVAMAYRGVQNGQDAFSVIRESTERGFKFVEMAGLTNWLTMVLNTSANAHVNSPLIFRQLFESETSTYTYLLADPVTKEALLIDPVLETAERDAKLIRELDLTLKYGLNTHVHADHITGTGKLKTIFPDCQSCISAVSGAASDVKLEEFDMVSIGSRHVFCYSTPGHTNGCITYVLDDGSMAFTGDTLLIRGCGRTDFQSGSSETLYDSIHQKIFSLKPDTKIYPGHDYKGMTSSSVAEEMAHNPRLTKSKEEFKDIMANLNLAYPKKIDASVPANMRCGF